MRKFLEKPSRESVDHFRLSITGRTRRTFDRVKLGKGKVQRLWSGRKGRQACASSSRPAARRGGRPARGSAQLGSARAGARGA